MFDELHEECGVFGAYNTEHAASITYYGLHSLQHRGQEASGIAVENNGAIEVRKGSGLTVDVFKKDELEGMKGRCAIGHVRYSTYGGSEYDNIQPIAANGILGAVAVVHNGQIVNEKELRKELEDQGCIFQGTSDSEIILHMLMKEQGSLLERAKKMASRLVGAFSILIMNRETILAIRDPWGLRPLSYARYLDGYVMASETCAFEVMGIYESWKAAPGTIVQFERGLVKEHAYSCKTSMNMCAMEYIYFARPDSVIEDINVHTFRKDSGKALALADADLEADIVIGVPDSSLSAAIGYAEAKGIPFETGLVKNRFVTRTFIQPTQALRDRGVRMKLSPVEEAIKDKRVVMIDDSIVRGTTSRRIVQLLKDAGAREVHVRIASPMIVSPCFYGVDTSTKEELIGARCTKEQIQEYIHADSLEFLSMERLKDCARGVGLCTACFDRHYCTPLFSYQKVLEKD